MAARPRVPRLRLVRSEAHEGRVAPEGALQLPSLRQAVHVDGKTVFERSHVPLHKWLYAAHLMAASKKGISAAQLHRQLGFGSYRTAWFVAMRLREAMRKTEGELLGGQGKWWKSTRPATVTLPLRAPFARMEHPS